MWRREDPGGSLSLRARRNDAAGDDGREPDVDDANEALKPAGIKSRDQIQELLHDRMGEANRGRGESRDGGRNF